MSNVDQSLEGDGVRSDQLFQMILFDDLFAPRIDLLHAEEKVTHIDVGVGETHPIVRIQSQRGSTLHGGQINHIHSKGEKERSMVRSVNLDVFPGGGGFGEIIVHRVDEKIACRKIPVGDSMLPPM